LSGSIHTHIHAYAFALMASWDFASHFAPRHTHARPDVSAYLPLMFVYYSPPLLFIAFFHAPSRFALCFFDGCIGRWPLSLRCPSMRVFRLLSSTVSTLTMPLVTSLLSLLLTSLLPPAHCTLATSGLALQCFV